MQPNINLENATQMNTKELPLILIAALMSAFSFATVTDSTQNAFTVSYSDTVATSPDNLYTCFSGKIARWWDPDHTYSGIASNLSVEPFAGGCFCEKLDNGGSIQHMTVLYAAPDKVFRMQGGLGPLQQFPVTGIMTLELKSLEKRTLVTWTYTVSGYIPGGVSRFAAVVNMVLGHQFKRFLKAAAE